MFGLFMAILFATVFIANGIKKYIDVYQDKKRSIKKSIDHFHDMNGAMVHIDDGLPYIYKNIDGNVYEINPYNYKIRRNITKERNDAKFEVFRRIAKERDIRFVEDISDDGKKVYEEYMYNRSKKNKTYYRHTHFDLKSLKSYPSNNVGYNSFIDTFTGEVYLPYKRQFDPKGEYIPYFMDPKTGLIKCVNSDMLDFDKEYIIMTEKGEIKTKPTEELITQELSHINKPIIKYLSDVNKLAILANEKQNEREMIEKLIECEIKTKRANGDDKYE